jgi:ABC-type branched-subunit amino acid transport system substrate-binding protein
MSRPGRLDFVQPRDARGVFPRWSGLQTTRCLNEQGGINGRKINLISLDDGYAPPRAVEQVRKLVEENQMLFTFQTLGTAANTAMQK